MKVLGTVVGSLSPDYATGLLIFNQQDISDSFACSTRFRPINQHSRATTKYLTRASARRYRYASLNFVLLSR